MRSVCFILFLSITYIEFVPIIRYFFCPYPHCCKLLNIFISVKSAYDIFLDGRTFWIGSNRIIPTINSSYIKFQSYARGIILCISNPIINIKFFCWCFRLLCYRFLWWVRFCFRFRFFFYLWLALRRSIFLRLC